ncbi:hypothetical protein OSTOST_24221 [Ostertagia ostertagi]
MFVFPSLAASVRAAFVFVQHGDGIDVSVSLCSRTFPEPNRVLDCFQTGEEPEIKLERDYSLEELYQLLDVVQNELDSMRSNPEEEHQVAGSAVSTPELKRRRQVGKAPELRSSCIRCYTVAHFPDTVLSQLFFPEATDVGIPLSDVGR